MKRMIWIGTGAGVSLLLFGGYLFVGQVLYTQLASVTGRCASNLDNRPDQFFDVSGYWAEYDWPVNEKGIDSGFSATHLGRQPP